MQLGYTYCSFVSSVYLVKGSRVVETTVPDLIHNLRGLHIVLDTWSVH